MGSSQTTYGAEFTPLSIKVEATDEEQDVESIFGGGSPNSSAYYREKIDEATYPRSSMESFNPVAMETSSCQEMTTTLTLHYGSEPLSKIRRKSSHYFFPSCSRINTVPNIFISGPIFVAFEKDQPLSGQNYSGEIKPDVTTYNLPTENCVLDGRNKVKHHCSVCGKGFSTPKNRIAHEIVKCNVPHPPERWKRHIVSKHEGHHPYKCSACGDKFTFKRRLQLHKETCPIFVSSNPKNRNAISLVEKEMRYISCIRRSSFGGVSDVVMHRPEARSYDRNTNPKPVKTFYCGRCVQVFDRYTKLYAHLLGVHGDIEKSIRGKYPCSVCGALLSSASQRAGHEAVVCHVVHPPSRLKELGVKIERCTVFPCGKMFWKEKDLENHILTSHKGMIPYICRHCGSNFSLKETLEGHEKTCEILFSDHSDAQGGNHEETQNYTEDNPFKSTLVNSNANPDLDKIHCYSDKENQNFDEDKTLLNTNPDLDKLQAFVKIETESSSYDDTFEHSSSIDIVDSIYIGAVPPTFKEEDDNVEITMSLPVAKAVSHTKKQLDRKTRKGDEIRKCLVCEISFDNGSNHLLQHVHVMHRHGPCPCSVCGKVLLSPKSCAGHEVTKCNVTHSTDLLSKLGVIILPCPVEGCGKLFWVKNYLMMHVLRHHDGEGLGCFSGIGKQTSI
ncbi:zinc finger protein 226 [Folsomia candida]|uniref:zinc finger protein 226 n=1 Tax=Folsomia candida TaxID=158441 RepID=UPI001604BE85|nr:zinc finger protein 226 [Folsomia candida]